MRGRMKILSLLDVYKDDVKNILKDRLWGWPGWLGH